MRGQMAIGVGNGVVAGALWGGVFLAPQVLAGFSALQLSAARYLVYGAAAAALLLPRWRALVLGRNEWLALLGLSLLGNIAYYIMLSNAVRWAGGAATSLIIGLLPVLVTLVGTRDDGAIRLGRLLAPLALCLLGVTLVGIDALLTQRADASPGLRAAGLLCAFGALASWTTYSVVNQRWLARRPDLSGHDWSLLTGVATGGLALLLVVPAFAGQQAERPAADWLQFWLIAAAVAIFASILGNGFWNRASRLLPLTLSGQMIIFETVFALLYGFLWAHRLPSMLEAAAIVCLIAGVVWCTFAHRAPA
ncbi:DMT family transporter [Jeongeupia chitinilytica]|uniref:Multidrug DMT transporter permease n=1 Tax=Jeongeupia chitinilytica TaxID=1041641 RepID=A0ABQ3GVE3_9NEIS|nr:DMT family transporter [Jeongeupia chitinilytica]GHD56246.1 multidrug DMT transporter permease [Jeongeupia chitinilytica]